MRIAGYAGRLTRMPSSEPLRHRDSCVGDSLGGATYYLHADARQAWCSPVECDTSSRRTFDEHQVSIHGPKLQCRRNNTTSDRGLDQLASNTTMTHDLKVSALGRCSPTMRLGIRIRTTTIVSLVSMPTDTRQVALRSTVQVHGFRPLPSRLAYGSSTLITGCCSVQGCIELPWLDMFPIELL
jgi:hypothetical protein